MPLYELRRNAENILHLPKKVSGAVQIGAPAVVDQILKAAAKKKKSLVVLEGWMGVPWDKIAGALEKAAAKKKMPARLIPTTTFYQSAEQMAAYKKPFISDDPAFGVVNDKGDLKDLFDAQKLAALKKELAARDTCVILYGCGAGHPELADLADVYYYVDMTRQPLLWQMWDGKLIPLGLDKPNPAFSWKEYYYNDFYMLERQKQFAFERMDAWIEGIEFDDLKLVPRAAYDTIIQTLVTYPVKEVKIFQPGPWGAYRYKQLWDVPGLECNAWNELAGPELSMLVDTGCGALLNMPVTNLMQYPELFVGPQLHKELPGMFPLDVWLDDGYFPKPTPAERISMPIHNHPSTDYVKARFNEPLGRYETYYIAEAYEGANTWMGFAEEADLEAWEAACYESERTGKPIPDWKDFIANHRSNVGDLYLIPPGTTHGHGGNQMVLEMDTVPSAAGTEYSFFMYDFCRPSWDDVKKTMTAKPLRMHNRHGFDMDQSRRKKWVEDHLRAKPEIVKWTPEFSMDRYTSYGPMPFEIERFHFEQRAVHDTEGKFLIIPTLTVGQQVLIRSLKDPKRCTMIEKFQSAVIPACFGPYEMINLTGGQATLTQIRWKRG